MRLPPPEMRHKVKRGQIWRRKKANPQGVHILLLVTGTRSNDWAHTVRYDNRKCAHRMRVKDLWFFYELVEKSKNKQSHNV